jgi:hypothetical protein
MQTSGFSNSASWSRRRDTRLVHDATLEQCLLNLDQGKESPRTDDDATSISSSLQTDNSLRSSSLNSSRLAADQYITIGKLKNLFKAVLKDRPESNPEGAICGPEQPKIDGGNKVPASKLEYKAVDEMYVFCLVCYPASFNPCI